MRKQLSFLSALITAIILIDGCKVGPNFQSLDPTTSSKYRYDSLEMAATDSALNIKWWDLFEDPDLDTLISRLTTYKNRYTGSDDHLSEVLSSAVGTPDSNILLKKFVDRVLID